MIKISKKILKKSAALVAIAAILIACGDNNQAETSAGASAWPHKNTKIIVPFNAGGSLDSMMRIIAPKLEKELGTKITIDNRPGAATQVGTTLFNRSKDDGSTLFAGTQLYLSASILLNNAEYSIDDFSVVNIEQFDPVTITVHKNSPYQTFDDLIEDVKNNPNKISYSTVHGGHLHLMGALLEDKLNISFNPVFYDGGGPMRNALLGEHVDFMIGNAHGDIAIADNARVLAVGSDNKLIKDLWPDAPSLNEVLAPYGVQVPNVGSARYLATHASFKDKHEDLFQILTNAYKNVFESEEYQAFISESNAISVSEYRGPEASDELNKSLHEILDKYKENLK